MTEGILHLVSGRAAALVAQDWAAIDAQLHPRFIYTNSQGNRLAKAAYLDFLSRGPLRWRRQWLGRSPSCTLKAPACFTG